MIYDRAKLRAELERDEGKRLQVYRCTAGARTIGIGRNLDSVGIRAAEAETLGLSVASCIARGITSAQAYALLDSDIDACERDLDRRLPWWRSLDDLRQRVVLNMCFNLGITRLLGFKNTLAAAQARRFADAAAGMKASAWHDQVGARAVRLEAMMSTGRG
jgi:lysozyme